MRLLYAAYVMSFAMFRNNVDPIGIVMNEVIRKDLIEPVMDDCIEKLNEK